MKRYNKNRIRINSNSHSPFNVNFSSNYIFLAMSELINFYHARRPYVQFILQYVYYVILRRNNRSL